ncbi:hypothetical protein C1645_825730 [Glomus cerebriforme]|uniref:Uncharacterized protein n=1 Tax=Glomus cerebriforme TaxID=658196 RepID=A0A397SV67_9GLOM|nr:hypothetical protein C1645_825730 [Glomus cerebriforme]
MTGRRSFWNKTHDTDLIIKICDGLRPPIVTNAPEGYIELMKEYIGPITTNNPGARYKSRSLSAMIKSAASTRSLKIQTLDYLTREFEFDIDKDIDSNKPNDQCYTTKEIDFDI